MKRSLKTRLQNDEPVFGTFISIGHTLTTEIVAKAGFDWVLIDLEHGLSSEQDVLQQLQAIEHTGVEAVIRVESSAKQRIHKVLDSGAHGIMCPHVKDAAEAASVVAAMRYAPHGVRGVAKMVRASGFGLRFQEYYHQTAAELLGVIQIECVEALDHLDAIAATEGVDVLFIGPADLSMALGIFGQLDHPKFLEAEAAIIAAAQRHGKAVGFLLFDNEHYQKYYDKGVRFFAAGTDALFLRNAAMSTAARLNELKAASAVTA